MKFKALSLLMAMVMVFSSIPAASAAGFPQIPAPEQSAQEHTHETEPVEAPAPELQAEAAPVLSQSIEDYPALTYGEEITLPCSSDTSNYATFTPERTGTYRFYSVGDRDPYAQLYDVLMNQIARSDDCYDESHGHPGSVNFCIIKELEAGTTYVLSVKLYGGDSSDVTIGVGCGHTYASEVIREATCAEPGITRHTCTVCGYSYDEEITVDHNYISEITKKATCAEPGIETFTCSECGHTYTEELWVSHTYLSEITDPGTCAEPGTMVNTCVVCGYAETKEYRVAHNYVSEIIKEATCTEDGVERRTCTACGYSYERDIWGHHDYETVHVPGSCTVMGYDIKTCTICGYSYTNEEDGWYEHDYENVIVKEPTCTEGGMFEERCTLCGDFSYSEEIDPLGHQYNDELTCILCGEAALTEGSWEHLRWSLVDGVLTITGEGEMPELEYVEAWNDFWIDNTPWKDLPVREAVIGEGITNVTAALFENREELQKVTLPTTVTAIERDAFDGCTALTAVRLPEGLTSIGSGAFSDCALTEIDLPESLTYIGSYAFANCDLRQVHIPAALTKMGSYHTYYFSCFHGNRNLARITVDENNTAYRCDDQGALYTKDLSELLLLPYAYEGTYVLPADTTEFYEKIFTECSGLDTILVEEGNALYYSKNGMLYLSRIYTACWDDNDNRIYVCTENVLYVCPPAKELGDFTIDAQTGGVDQYAFQNCTKLTELTIPATCTINVQHYVNMAFRSIVSGCSNLKAVWFEEGHPECFSDENGFVYNARRNGVGLIDEYEAGTVLEYVPAARTEAYLEIPEGIEAVSADLTNPNLRAIRFPSTLRGLNSYVLEGGNVEWILFTGEKPEVSYMGDPWATDLHADLYYPGWMKSWENGCELDEDSTYVNYIPYEQGQEPVWGEEPEKPENPFTDVPADSFYAAPVAWAVEKNITTGASENSFNPNGQCLRAQVVTFLWRAEGCPEPKSLDNPFVDVSEKDFYFKAVLWAVENKITNGSDATHFNPFGVCNRAQVVTFLHRAKGSPAPASLDLPFTDVPSNSFYAAPVAWAVENNITNGLSATAFGPNAACNRAQVVTFLYRAYH